MKLLTYRSPNWFLGIGASSVVVYGRRVTQAIIRIGPWALVAKWEKAAP